MRLSQLLVAIAVTCLFTSDALTTNTDSNQAKLSKGTVVNGPIQRRLEVALTIDQMKALMAEGVNEEAYAQRLGVHDRMKKLTEAGGTGLYDFMMTDEYKKINAYQDFLREARREAKRAQEMEALRALKKSKAKINWSSIKKVFRSKT
ncbi:hypothetical protein PR003_g26880 [Phytophthora rubi]|uniref:PexRD2 WYL domain-containing protein n=1 Tax=Phytophthora rubi TaxID=129364 RepID=A0A6A4C610_9STRA|nr:hypothetical protein PR001_g25723 [Phytophthora rubi]KAE9284322.1 hypothetical protein PR003_g26880 [Phytophthora rubi]